jgi:hypothetical protein
MSGGVLIDDETLQRMADRFGPSSRAGRALAEARRQRTMGIDAVILHVNRHFSVCSRRFAMLRLEHGN